MVQTTTSHGPNYKVKKVPETRRRDGDAGNKDLCLEPRINGLYNSEHEVFLADFFSGCMFLQSFLMTFQNHVCPLYLQGLDTISLIRGKDWSELSVYQWRTASQHIWWRRTKSRQANINFHLATKDDRRVSGHERLSDGGGRWAHQPT